MLTKTIQGSATIHFFSTEFNCHFSVIHYIGNVNSILWLTILKLVLSKSLSRTSPLVGKYMWCSHCEALRPKQIQTTNYNTLFKQSNCYIITNACLSRQSVYYKQKIHCNYPLWSILKYGEILLTSIIISFNMAGHVYIHRLRVIHKNCSSYRKISKESHGQIGLKLTETWSQIL